MDNRYGHKLTINDEFNNQQSIWNISMVLLTLYVLLNFLTQEGMITPMYHTLVLYAFFCWTVVSVLRQRKIVLSDFTIWQGVMLGSGIISAVLSQMVVMSALTNMIIGIVLSFCFIHTLNSRERLETCLLTFIIAADILGIWLLLSGKMITEDSRLGQELTGNANSFSALIMVAAIFAAWFTVYKKGKVRRYCFASLAFCIYMMALSGGRKTILALAVTLAYFILSNKHTKNRKVVGNILKAALALGVVYYIIMNNPDLYNTIGYRFEGLMNFASGGESEVSSDAIRQRLIEIGLEKWTESPLFGYGVDTFKYYNRRMTGRFYYAHNNYVELLFDVGVLGFVIYYFFYYRMFKQYKKLPAQFSAYKSLGIGMLLCMLVYDIGGISYYTVLIQYVLAITYCIIPLCQNAESES